MFQYEFVILVLNLYQQQCPGVKVGGGASCRHGGWDRLEFHSRSLVGDLGAEAPGFMS